ncbi:HD domain-containing protein [Rhodovastum atsumiense]|uniref:HD domain-containing protein n=1 Tax=Rhodovastum atsumiense TaxID=504468 RepID=A0A5M6IL69_9PROT|nr:HD domain-containing protein [Rhodovastum atsumiense]KAA5609006.1 HD domain-containing protein [Rhodovastum atsumiense]CAH2599078.1 HD domain-containing protein [Rhodovastum atsumiense]
MSPDAFTPHVALAARLLPRLDAGDDGAHDLAHLLRVWRNAQAIAAVEGGAGDVLAAAVLLHDCVAVEKSSPLRAQASRLAADRARDILGDLGWPAERIEAVAHAIAAHSFSAGIAPASLEARVLQDADRLDAIGHIGIARCFYTGGRLGSALYDPWDIRAERRQLDDAHYALDHFRAKLLRLADGFQTGTGARMAAQRTQVIATFLAGFEQELG